MKRCPVCSTIMNPRNHKALCAHVIWNKKKGWVRRRPTARGGVEHIQGQKYNVNPLWRRKLGGKKGEIL